MADGLSLQVKGIARTRWTFDELGTASQRRIMRPALDAGGRVVLAAAKADVEPGTFKDSSGATRRSLGIKKGLGKQGLYVVVGARNKQGDRMHATRGAFGTSRKPRLRRPIRYLHLINKWLPFINAALDENIGAVNKAIRSRAKIELKKEVKSLRAKAKAKARRAG